MAHENWPKIQCFTIEVNTSTYVTITYGTSSGKVNWRWNTLQPTRWQRISLQKGYAKRSTRNACDYSV